MSQEIEGLRRESRTLAESTESTFARLERALQDVQAAQATAERAWSAVGEGQASLQAKMDELAATQAAASETLSSQLRSLEAQTMNGLGAVLDRLELTAPPAEPSGGDEEAATADPAETVAPTAPSSESEAQPATPSGG
ncbi:MAG: hypothetical protein AB1778_00720 [Candidatus Bipolaricaulota bacterium]